MTDRPIRRAFSLSGTQPSLAAMPWWCSPAGLAFGFLLPVMGVIYLGGESGASGLTIRGVRYLNEHFLLLGALLIISLALPAWLGAQIQLSRTRQEPNYADWDVAVQFVAGIAVFAYLIWFKDIFFSPATLFGVLTGSVKLSRSEIGLTPGLTSLANMAPAFYSIYAYRLLKNASCRVPRALHIWFGVLLSLTLFRVYVWSERLALIELLIPFGLAMGWWVANRRSARFWSIVRVFGPFAALPFIILFFGASEYFRSWTSDTYRGKMDFWDFVIGRLASYYYTALNNGAGMVVILPNATFEFEFLLEWLHKAPFGLGKPFSEYVGWQESRFFWYLHSYQDPEFNSPSAIYAVLNDMGLYGGIGYFMLEGLIAGLAFRAYRRGGLAGVLIFPLFFISLAEIYRYTYLGQPRAFTWVLAMILVAVLVVMVSTVRKARAAGRVTSSQRGWAPTVLTAPSGLGD